MALFYVFGCIYILCVNHAFLWPALKLIVSEAFSLKAAAGGTTGTVIMLAARYGIARGLFSNESGLGSAPIVAAAAQTKNPVRQALVSSSGTFWDTVVICAMTGLVVVSCIIADPQISASDAMPSSHTWLFATYLLLERHCLPSVCLRLPSAPSSAGATTVSGLLSI